LARQFWQLIARLRESYQKHKREGEAPDVLQFVHYHDAWWDPNAPAICKECQKAGKLQEELRRALHLLIEAQ